MKKKILLVDDSLTVQKVVSLTLDKAKFAVSYAKTRQEFMKLLLEQPPNLILVSDQVPEINASSFPKEVESWLGRNHSLPAFVLITSQDTKEMRHYQAVIKKPFSPQVLQAIVQKFGQENESTEADDEGEIDVVHASSLSSTLNDEIEDQHFQKRFNDVFSDESSLVRETFETDFESDEPTVLSTRVGVSAASARAARHEEVSGTELWQERVPNDRPSPAAAPAPAATTPKVAANASNLWSNGGANVRPNTTSSTEILSAEDSMAYKALLHQQVETKLGAADLHAIIDKVLAKMLPPIVEKLVQERLDKLLKEHEQSLLG